MAAPRISETWEHTGVNTATRPRADVAVGKDVLELLSTAMYAEPLAVVREYIQNAADSIDAAFDAGLLGSERPGRIDVEIDPLGRELRIRDNGIGVSASSVEPVLLSFGASAKRGTKARGFRGVGRLGGLGYAQRVLFRTRAAGDDSVVQVSWDCRVLKHILHDSDSRLDLQEAVRRVVTVERYPGRELPERFFEVCLQGVVRLSHDRLLNQGELTKYLQQVSPLPMDPALPFAADIEAHLSEYLPRRRIDLHVNGQGPVYRPFALNFPVSGSKRDRFRELQRLRFDALDGSTSAVGWVLHHGYLGALQSAPEIRGLRGRIGDIQIGEEGLFAEVFPEVRFNGWVVGELHVLDKGIRPNGRRDNFEHNAAHSHLLGQLIPVGRDVARRCRSSSAIRARLRSFEASEQQVAETMTLLRKRQLSGGQRRERLLAASDALSVMERVAGGGLLADAGQVSLQKRVARCRASFRRMSKLGEKAGDPMALLPRAKRALYGEFLNALYECMPNKTHADRLVRRVTRRLVGGGQRRPKS